MKTIAGICISLILIALTSGGCNHGTNNQEPPEGSDFHIVSPQPQSLVEGAVVISVNLNGISPSSIQFLVDGRVIETSSGPPWQGTWNTAGLHSNTYHTIKARAYNGNNGYKTTQDVVVKIK